MAIPQKFQPGRRPLPPFTWRSIKVGDVLVSKEGVRHTVDEVRNDYVSTDQGVWTGDHRDFCGFVRED